MGWKTVIVKEADKISLFLDNILISRKDINFKINIHDISCIFFEDYKTVLTTRMINKLSDLNILIIFCNENLMPNSQTIPVKGKYNQLAILQKQIKWNTDFKTKMWEDIIKQKINNQIDVMKNNNSKLEKINLMYKYISEMVEGDLTNREGHAAKVYFKEIFGSKFTRDTPCVINSALDYGYTIFRAAISRTIVSKGLHPSIALFHHNKYDVFALSDDLIEPFRPFVDEYVLKNFLNREYFSRDEKIELINLLNAKIIFQGKEFYILNAMEHYVESIINSFEYIDLNLIKYPFPQVVEYYEL